MLDFGKFELNQNVTKISVFFASFQVNLPQNGEIVCQYMMYINNDMELAFQRKRKCHKL